MKVLALVNALAAAHVARPLEIAKILRPLGYEMIFAGCGKYLEMAKIEGFETVELPGIDSERIRLTLEAPYKNPLYRENEIEPWIQAELSLVDKIKPQVLLSDNRITASTTAEISRLKMISIFNSHMSVHRKFPMLGLDRSEHAILNPMIDFFNKFDNQVEFLFWDQLVCKNINKVRKKLNLRPKHSYTLDEGDLNLIPDVPDFNPLAYTPSNYQIVGPLPWKSNFPAPTIMSQLDPGKKLIYFTLGSEGLEDLAHHVEEVIDPEVQVIVATGGAKMSTSKNWPPNLHFEKYVNADLVLPHYDLVLCHGGNGTIYQALNHGVPDLTCEKRTRC